MGYENGIHSYLMGFYGELMGYKWDTLWSYKKLLKICEIAIEIVDLPSYIGYKMVIFRYVNVYQRVLGMDHPT